MAGPQRVPSLLRINSLSLNPTTRHRMRSTLRDLLAWRKAIASLLLARLTWLSFRRGCWLRVRYWRASNNARAKGGGQIDQDDE